MRPAVLSFACLMACVGEGEACGLSSDAVQEAPCGGGATPLPGLPLELACTLVKGQQALRSPPPEVEVGVTKPGEARQRP